MPVSEAQVQTYSGERSPVQMVAHSILDKIPALFHPAIKRIPGEMGETINTMLYGNPLEAHNIARRAIETIQAVLVADGEFISRHFETPEQRASDDTRTNGLGQEHTNGDNAQAVPEQLQDSEGIDHRQQATL